MPSASHRWCKRCHKQRIDKRAGLEMCQRCKRITLAERRADRHAIKARKALRAVQEQGVATMPAEPKPEPAEAHTTNGRVRHISDDIKLIVAGHYANYDIPVESIVRSYGISNGDMTKIVDELGIPRRDKRNVGKSLPRGSFEDNVWVADAPLGPPPFPATATEARARAESVPEPVHKALENMLKLPPAPEPPVPVRAHVTVKGSTVVWEVQVQGLIHVTGDEIEDALAAVKGIYPSLRITGIRQA